MVVIALSFSTIIAQVESECNILYDDIAVWSHSSYMIHVLVYLQVLMHFFLLHWKK